MDELELADLRDRIAQWVDVPVVFVLALLGGRYAWLGDWFGAGLYAGTVAVLVALHVRRQRRINVRANRRG
jgi:hypothetical protein